MTVTKGVSIIGAGTNATMISRAGKVFHVSPGADKAVRISNMMLNIGGYFGGNYPIEVATSETSTNLPLYKIRIDHIWFEKGQYTITLTGINAWGVIDHCTFHNCDNGVQLNGGSAVWSYPILAGTTNCMVIEDNLFLCDTKAADMNECIMSGHGVRFVVRNNTFDGTAYRGNDFLCYENHGKGDLLSSPPTVSDLRGPPIFEIYNNTMKLYTGYRIINIRGGSGIVFSN
ncbi:MAG TPA: hypothetical protein VK633_03940, partial [Verrucomicrobiae bacterium]|nr:hypothetical protein [Verrucomicrobiae bacterium]